MRDAVDEGTAILLATFMLIATLGLSLILASMANLVAAAPVAVVGLVPLGYLAYYAGRGLGVVAVAGFREVRSVAGRATEVRDDG